MSDPPITREYDIQVGPFDVNDAPARVLGFSDTATNVNYFKMTMFNGDLSMGILFSRGGFITNLKQSLGDVRTLWVINLKPVRILACDAGTTAVENIPADENNRLLEIGSITHLAWNRKYILQPEHYNLGVLMRAVDRNDDGEITGLPPFHVHNNDPGQMLPPHQELEMPDLLSRLAALTA
jgi:hypothetical protein